MTGTHASHELIELLAALILTIGGGSLLVRAALARRERAPVTSVATPGPAAPERRLAMSAMRRTEDLVIVALSAAAAVIHLAAGPAHVEELGDLGLGFYWAAGFQGVFAIAWWRSGGSRRLALSGMVANVALLVAWAWSRALGIPGTPGPEAMGVADGTVVLLQLTLVGALIARTRGYDTMVEINASPARLRTAATSGLVAILGVIALSTTIAVAASGQDHHAADDGHGAMPTSGQDHHAADDGHGAMPTSGQDHHAADDGHGAMPTSGQDHHAADDGHGAMPTSGQDHHAADDGHGAMPAATHAPH